MKKPLTLLAFFGLLATPFSCVPDDAVEEENEIVIDSEITGIWHPKDAVVEGVVFPYDDHETCGKDYMKLGTDGSYQEVDILDCEEIIDLTGTYKVEGDQLIINAAGETAQAEILELEEESLVLLIIIDHNGDGDMEEVRASFTRE